MDIFQPGYQHPSCKAPDYKSQAYICSSSDMNILTRILASKGIERSVVGNQKEDPGIGRRVGQKDVSLTSQLKYRFTFSAQDGAEPSANSSSVGNLIRLSSFVDQKSYTTKAEEIIKASATLFSKIPLAIPELVSNYIMYLQPTKQVNILVQLVYVT